MIRPVSFARVVPVVGMAMLAYGMPSHAAIAQQRVATETAGRIVPSTNELLDRRVTVTLDGVTLSRAIREAAAAADVRVLFEAETVERYAKAVTIQLTNVSLQTAFEKIFAGTALHVIPNTATTLIVREYRPSAVQGTITGVVRDAKTKQPVAGATILLNDATAGVVTAEDGTFRLNAPAGDQRITVRAVGFGKSSRSVTVPEGSSVSVELLIERSTSVLSEVVVTGSVVATERKAIPTPITVITAEEIERRGITRVDQLLRGQVPGVIALETGSMTYNGNVNNGGADSLGMMSTSRVFSRGASSAGGANTPLKTYIDGVELLNPAYLGTIDPKNIERIEIITGPQAATIYGSGAMGGVMQIFTKKGVGHTTPDVTLSLRYGMLENSISNGRTPMHNHSLSVLGGSGPEFSYSGTAGYTYTGQWQPKLFARGYSASAGVTHSRGPLTASGSYSAVAGSNGTSGWGAGLSSGPVDIQMRNTGQWAQANMAGYNSQRKSTTSSQTASLNVDLQATSFLQHHLTVGRNQTEFALDPFAPIFKTPSDTLFKTSSSNGRRTTGSYNMTLAALGTHALSSTLTIGGNGSWARQTQFTACTGASTSTVYQGCDGSTIILTKALDNDSWGGFGSLQVSLFDQLHLTFGMRGEHNSYYGRDHKIDWTPTQGIAYALEYGELTIKLLGSYGRATRAPNAAQRLAVVLQLPGSDPSQFTQYVEAPGLRPERSRGPQGGIELYYGNLGSITINRYRQMVTDLIQAVKVDSVLITDVASGIQFYGGMYQYRNLQRVVQEGWEGTASLNVGALSFRGTYSWNDSYVATAPYRTFASLPSHIGNLTASYALGGTSVSLSSNFVGTSNQRLYDGVDYYDRLYSRLKMYMGHVTTPPGVNNGDFYAKPGYVKSDLAVSHRLTRSISAILNVNNLNNSFGTDVSNLFPTMGRQSMFGVSIKFPDK